MLNLPIKILKTVQIETQTVTITIDNIDTLVAQWDAIAHVTSRHLVLIINARCIDVSDSITNFLRFNGDSGMNYFYQRLSGVDGNDTAGRVDGANAINLPPIPGANNANTWGGSEVIIPDAFDASVHHKAVQAMGGSVEFTVEAVEGRWANVAAITSVTVFEGVGDEFEVGSIVQVGVVDERYLVEEWISTGVGTPTPTPIFDNIPQGEGDLVIVGSARSSQAANEDEVLHYINDDGVAANHPAIELLGRGAARTSAAVAGEIAMIPGQTAGANIFGALVVNYSQYTKGNDPHFLSLSGYQSGIPLGEVRLMSGRRDNIEPINKIELDPTLGINMFTGSLFSLYRVPKRIIERQVITADQAVITLDNIPQNFEDLVLTVYTQTDRAAGSDPVRFTINADGVAANYNKQELYGFGGAVTALRTAADRDWMLVSASVAVEEFDGGVLLFPAYAKTDRHKHVIGLFGNSDNSIYIQSSRWLSTAAIISIAITPVNGPNFVAGTIVELEGILRREGLPPSEGEQFGV